MGSTEPSVRPGKVLEDDPAAARFVPYEPSGRARFDATRQADPVVAVQVRGSRRIVVVIPAHNEQDQIAAAVAGISAQTMCVCPVQRVRALRA